VAYPQQLASKDQILRDQLIRNQLTTPNRVLPAASAPDEWRYRNRVNFKCRHTHQDEFVIGFYRSGSHYVVDVDTCLLIHPHIQNTLELLRFELPRSPAPNAIPQVDVTSGDDGAIQLIVHVLPEAADLLHRWLSRRAKELNWNASLQSGRKTSLCHVHGETSQRVGFWPYGLELSVSPGGFAQVNSVQNENLVSNVLSCAKLSGQERVLDLFCGAGNFSLPLAQHAGQVVGVEAYGPAICDARANAKANQLTNVSFFEADAARALATTIDANDFDVVIIDPPRTGCYDVVNLLKQCQRLQKVIYISCNPGTLSRDLVPLIYGGFEVMSSQAFDLFPQTWHIESVTCLERQR
jgi:23S rRNA (uracil1939-C5)-methyltransferase